MPEEEEEDNEDELAKKLATVCQHMSSGEADDFGDLNLVDKILKINSSEDLDKVKNRMSKVIKVALQVGANNAQMEQDRVSRRLGNINYSERTQSVLTTS